MGRSRVSIDRRKARSVWAALTGVAMVGLSTVVLPIESAEAAGGPRAGDAPCAGPAFFGAPTASGTWSDSPVRGRFGWVTPSGHLVVRDPATGAITDDRMVVGLPASRYAVAPAEDGAFLYLRQAGTVDVYAIPRRPEPGGIVPSLARRIPPELGLGGGCQPLGSTNRAPETGATAPDPVPAPMVDLAPGIAPAPGAVPTPGIAPAPGAIPTPVPPMPAASTAPAASTSLGPALVYSTAVDRVSARPGDDLVYTVEVSNSGDQAATNVPVLDTLPDGVSFVYADHGGSLASADVSWVIPSLAPGEAVLLTAVGRLGADAAPGAYINSAMAVDPSGAAPTAPRPAPGTACTDPSLAGRSCVRTDIPEPGRLVFATSVDRATAARGDTVTYSILVTNQGGTDMNDVSVVDQLPSGVNVVSTVPTAQIDGGELRWSIPVVAAGQTVTLSVVGQLAANAPAGPAVNAVAVANALDTPPGTPDPAPESACADDPTRACAETSVFLPGVLVFATTVNKATARPGDQLTYTITVSYGGSEQVADIPVEAVLPHAVSLVSATPGAAVDGQTLRWSVPKLSPGKSVTFTVVGQLSPRAAAGAYVSTVYARNPAVYPPGSPAAIPALGTACAEDATRSCASVPVASTAVSAARLVTTPTNAALAATGAGSVGLLLGIAGALALLGAGAWFASRKLPGVWG